MSKQGVAQRIRAEHQQYRYRLIMRMDHLSGLELHNAQMALAIHDTFMMTLNAALDELSAEARRVLAETKKSRDSLTDEHMGTDYYGINCAMQGMQLLAQRLGLDLTEPEDSDE